MSTSSILEKPIKCPNCGEPISLDATLGPQLATEAEARIKKQKAWDKKWVPKLKEDQRQAKAELAIIVSNILPPEIRSFGDIDGVYVTNFDCLFSVAKVLRAMLIQEAATKRSLVGTTEKMEVTWHYLHGTAFKQRVEAILEAFSAMSTTLAKEKKSITRIWAEREMQIKRVVDNTIGMHGDLQGLAGGSIPMIQSLELPLLEDSNDEAYIGESP